MSELDDYAAKLIDSAEQGIIHDNCKRARIGLYKLMNKTKHLTNMEIKLPIENPYQLAKIITIYNTLLKTKGFYKLGLEKRMLLPPEREKGVGGWHTL